MRRALRRVVRLATISIGVGALTLMAVPRATAEADMTSFAIDAPSGYTVATDAPIAGLHSFDEFLAITGQKRSDFGNFDTSSLSVFSQVWVAEDGTRAVTLVIETPSADDGAGFVAGALSGANGETFDPGLDGARARVAHLGGVTQYVAVWHQGLYGVYVATVEQGLGDPTAKYSRIQVVQRLALAQSQRLTTVLGAGFEVAGVDPSGDTLTRPIAIVVGIVVVVGVVLGVALLIARRSRRKHQPAWSPASIVQPYPPLAQSHDPSPMSLPVPPPQQPSASTIPPPPSLD